MASIFKILFVNLFVIFIAISNQIEQSHESSLAETSSSSSSSILSSVLSSSTRSPQDTQQSNVNRNFIHIQHHQQHHQAQSSGVVRSHSSHYHHNNHNNHDQSGSKPHLRSSNQTTSFDNNVEIDANNQHQPQSQQFPPLPPPSQQPQQIFINQSNNIYILAKYGQTVYLPCLVFKQSHFDLSNVHVIWHRLYDRTRPIVLSIGLQQLKQDMRYRVKLANMNRPKSSLSLSTFDNEPLAFGQDQTDEQDVVVGNDLVRRSDATDDFLSINETVAMSHTTTTTTTTEPRNDYLIQNWQFEIRKLTYDDAGTYQCLLGLVKPIAKNITLQVIPDLTIEPKETGSFKLDDKIVLKCRTTIRSLHKTQSPHLIHQRQSKSSILWYKENEIIKSTASATSSAAAALARSGQQDQTSLAAAAVVENNSEIPSRKFEIETKLDNNEQTLNSILTINHAREDDSGKYRCIYDNIQEQINVRVVNDNYEYKNYLSSLSNTAAANIPTTILTFLLPLLVVFNNIIRLVRTN